MHWSQWAEIFTRSCSSPCSARNATSTPAGCSASRTRPTPRFAILGGTVWAARCLVVMNLRGTRLPGGPKSARDPDFAVWRGHEPGRQGSQTLLRQVPDPLATGPRPSCDGSQAHPFVAHALPTHNWTSTRCCPWRSCWSRRAPGCLLRGQARRRIGASSLRAHSTHPT
jgi:hypothetical protein